MRLCLRKNLLLPIKKCVHTSKYILVLIFVLIALNYANNFNNYIKLVSLLKQNIFDKLNNLTFRKLNSYQYSNKNASLVIYEDLHDFLADAEYFNSNHNQSSNLQPCQIIPSGLVGQIEIDLTRLGEKQLKEKFKNGLGENSGGHWRPSNCLARHKVAVVVPYRDRDEHLKLFLNHMHLFLQKQLLDYTIYIIEQVKFTKFNRAKLMNIGYREAIKDYDWACFVFHDVDLVPENDLNIYSCPIWPRHMSIAVNTLKYQLPYREIFGGVSAIKRSHFEIVNGYSNLYFGWGGEGFVSFFYFNYEKRYKNLFILIKKTTILPKETIARYYMLLHEKDEPSKQRYKLLDSAHERFTTDGLNSLKYKVIQKEYRMLYTWLLVSFEEPNE